MAWCFKKPWLTQGTIHDNIAFGKPEASREQVIAAAKAANADFFIQQLPQGYDTKLEKCWRISLCRPSSALDHSLSLSGYSKDSYLDEATSSIDTRTEVLVQDAL